MAPPKEAEATHAATSVQQGLLDLSVDLSSPQIFSGSLFALYLRVKNPFSAPIWIRQVKMNLPTTVYWDGEDSATKETTSHPARSEYLDNALSRMAALQRRLAELEKEPLAAETTEEMNQLRSSAAELHEQLFNSQGNRDLFLTEYDYDIVNVGGESTAHFEEVTNRRLSMSVGGGSHLHVESIIGGGDDYVPLQGSQPLGTALQPGNDNVWTIILGTKRNLFFLPATYKINVNVLYALHPPTTKSTETDSQVFSNTIPTAVTIRTSLWSVMAGSVAGGLLGATARLLQQIGTANTHITFAAIGGPLLLAGILSIAAAIFAARKSETQSFVSVEDFWGGALIGFLIGYSGTVAFEDLTRISGASSSS